MAEPKKRLTSHRSGNRQSHDALKKQYFVKCKKCNEAKLPHRICGFCGNKESGRTKTDKSVVVKESVEVKEVESKKDKE